MFPIINNSGNCRDCYRCLRNCDVKAISFRTGQAKIMTDQVTSVEQSKRLIEMGVPAEKASMV